ncbi:MAG: ribosomal-processing cysteine protease Prp [Clostridiales bacterium]|nr:ribosomal-processing cysteine protease Prp [Clostridiales bacterium]
MIRVIYDGGQHLTLSGHAAYAPRGQDIVCAAASALVYALVGALEERALLTELTIQPGYVSVSGKAAGAAEFALTAGGLRQLAGRYPGFVTVEEQPGESETTSGFGYAPGE